MIKRNKKKSFARSASQNRALMKGLFRNLLLNGAIKTTEPKAKSLKRYTDKIFSKLKKNNNNSSSLKLISPNLIDKANKKIKKYKAREGGYTRVVKIDDKRGDNAKMAIIKFV